jgi:topoisomerase-4 subunit A
MIKKKFGTGKERKTEIRSFDTISATEVAVANARLYVNKTEGFIGTSLKKDEYICDCSDIDDILVIRKNGKYLITKVSEKILSMRGCLKRMMSAPFSILYIATVRQALLI